MVVKFCRNISQLVENMDIIVRGRKNKEIAAKAVAYACGDTLLILISSTKDKRK